MPLHHSGGLHLLDLRMQRMYTALAHVRQDIPSFIDVFNRHQGAMGTRWPGCPAGLRRVFLPRPRWRGLRVYGLIHRKTRLGGIRGVLLAQCQLPFADLCLQSVSADPVPAFSSSAIRSLRLFTSSRKRSNSCCWPAQLHSA